MELAAEVSKLSQRRKAEAGVRQGIEKYNLTGCADAANVGIIHFGVLLPPTCSSSVSHLYHASQVKMLLQRIRLCVFSRSSCSKPPLLSVTRRVLGIETFFKMGY